MNHESASASQRSSSAANPASLEEILINSKLQTRPHREPNLQDEGMSLRILARMLRSAPNELINTLLEMAISLCHAETAGLSVLETLPNGEEIFRWTHLAGTLKRFVGGYTLRDFSPCGVCLDHNAPQLFSYPARRFQYLSAAVDIPIVEALVIPVPLGASAPATIWILSHKEGVEFDAEDARIMTDLADFTGCALDLVAGLAAEQLSGRQSRTEAARRKLSEEALTKGQADLEGIVTARTAQLSLLTARLQTIQDAERRRIARDLHDSAGQYLAAIQMDLQSLLQDVSKIDERIAKHVISASESTNRCAQEIRTISYLLHPPLLDEAGLSSALAWYLDGFAGRSGILVEAVIPDNLPRFPGDIETALFRVVQQGLVNIHRHSHSPIARVAISVDGKQIALEVGDEGVGIPPEILSGFLEGAHLTGVGLAGMRERITSMGGKFDLQSGKGGTRILVSLPLPG